MGTSDLNAGSERNTVGDEKLLEGIRRKEPEAIEALYDQLSRQAFGLAYRILGDGQSAEDVVQDVFLNVWRQAHRLDAARGRVSSLVMTMVHHRAIDVLRSRRGLQARNLPLEPAALTIAGGGPDPADRLVQAADRESVQKAFALLPEDQMKAIHMAYFEGLTHAEIAKTLDLPLGTVKSRLRLALERMRKMAVFGESA
jgi:RNA polymerase sigma-70 factor (ECF subfamily)